jgi:hypothetical protein
MIGYGIVVKSNGNISMKIDELHTLSEGYY